ncbi:hypothetical protein SESBI_43807 [Sesbania bispinosa]|nr:hypothetical protein SESBI_43807 [Sesbania bispinosa]
MVDQGKSTQEDDFILRSVKKVKMDNASHGPSSPAGRLYAEMGGSDLSNGSRFKMLQNQDPEADNDSGEAANPVTVEPKVVRVRDPQAEKNSQGNQIRRQASKKNDSLIQKPRQNHKVPTNRASTSKDSNLVVVNKDSTSPSFQT